MYIRADIAQKMLPQHSETSRHDHPPPPPECGVHVVVRVRACGCYAGEVVLRPPEHKSVRPKAAAALLALLRFLTRPRSCHDSHHTTVCLKKIGKLCLDSN